MDSAELGQAHASPSCEHGADAGQGRFFVNPHDPLRREKDSQKAAFFTFRDMGE
jgi:hypothetical protein